MIIILWFAYSGVALRFGARQTKNLKLHNQFEIIAEAVEDRWGTDAGLRSVPTHEKGQKQSDSQLELETSSSSFVKASTTSQSLFK